jgi:uncharacterized protein (DUF2164 family)
MDRMKNKFSASLSKESRTAMVTEVKNYFLNERDEEIGDLAAGLILNFFLDRIGPDIYNQGVEDSHRYMKDAAEDLLSIRA